MKNWGKSVFWKFDFLNFSAHALSNTAISATKCWQKLILKVEFNWKDDNGSNHLLTDPLK